MQRGYRRRAFNSVFLYGAEQSRVGPRRTMASHLHFSSVGNRTARKSQLLRCQLATQGNLGNIDAYISAVNRLPMLTHEEEISLAKRLREATTSTPRKSWCCRTCAWWCRSRAATWATACRTPT
jgi:hypothetical protein